ncbi:MAG: RNA polymerase factor sigma-54 [Pseudomonadota bacterium]
MHGLRLEIRQTQQLVMTPQLQQAIRLLQMTNLELDAHVSGLVEANPLLSHEAAEEGQPAAPMTEAMSEPMTEPGAERMAGPAAAGPADGPPGEDPARTHDGLDADLGENLYEGAAADPVSPPATATRADRPAPLLPAGGGEGPGIDHAADGPGMRESLAMQLRQTRLAPAVLAAAVALVEALDEDGYLREPMAAAAERLGIDPALAEAGLMAVQGCEPTGIGARNLAECLALQLAEKGRLDPMIRCLLDNLALLERGDRRRLCLACAAQPDDIADMLAELRRLDPRPGARFRAEDPAPRIPDILMRRTADGGWEIALNSETLPRVAVDQTYALRLDATGRETDRWIAERRAEAQWLVRSIAKRAETILAVATEIARVQDAFFEQGASALRPLTLRQVAEATGLHESTVSRVASGKLVATPRGVFELRYFFTNAVGTGDQSAESVRQRLRALVEAEPPDGVLSDDDLVEALKREGIEIARRTVAKYRKVLGIPSSVDRRRRKAFA